MSGHDARTVEAAAKVAEAAIVPLTGTAASRFIDDNAGNRVAGNIAAAIRALPIAATPADDVVERVARAICAAHSIPADDWDEDDNGRRVRKWECEVGAARAALAALAPAPDATDALTWPDDAMFASGDMVQKKGIAQWRGKIVGWYRPANGKLGFSVESMFEHGSVQIYPQTALEPLDAALAPGARND